MSNNINNREEWLNTLKDSLQEYTAAPPSGGWESVSNAIIKKRVQSRVLRVIGGISAVAAVALIFLFLPLNREEALENRVAIVESNLDSGVSRAENMAELEISNEKISAEENIDIYRASDKVSDNSGDKVAPIDSNKGKQVVVKDLVASTVKEEKESGENEAERDNNEIESENNKIDRGVNSSERDGLTWEEYLASEPKEREKKRGKLRNLLAVQFGNGSAGGVKTSGLSNTKSEFVASNNSVAQNNLGFSTESLTSTMATQSLTNIEQQTSYSSVNTLPLSNLPEPKLISGVRGITREYKHKQPLTFSLMVGKELSDRFTLESGLSYTLLSSDMYIVESGKTYKQQLHYIGLPLKFNWNFVNKPKFMLYSGAGALLEKPISSKLGSTKLDINALDVAATLGVGAQYKFTNRLGIYLEPSAIYYFGMDESGVLAVTTNNIEIKSVRSEYPLGFALNGGLRFSF